MNSEEPCEKFEMTSTSIEIEKSANATNATSESIASISESDSLERVRSETIALDTEAPGSTKKFSQFLISLEQIQTFTELDQVFYLNVRVSLVPSLFFGYSIIVKYFRTHEFLFIFPNLLPFSSKSQKRSKKKSQKFEQPSLNHKKRHLKFSMTSRSSRSTKALM